MSDTDRLRWNTKYQAVAVPASVRPDEWLARQALRVTPGQALELACGLGHNSIWLAQNGWNVEAIDISASGLSVAKELEIAEMSRQQTVPSTNRHDRHQVSWIEADLDEFKPKPDSFDLVVVFRFLDRRHLPEIVVNALRPGGLLVYETFSRTQMARSDNHLRSVEFTLAPNELVEMFSTLDVVEYQEVDLPDRSVARLAARKRGDYTSRGLKKSR